MGSGERFDRERQLFLEKKNQEVKELQALAESDDKNDLEKFRKKADILRQLKGLE